MVVAASVEGGKRLPIGQQQPRVAGRWIRFELIQIAQEGQRRGHLQHSAALLVPQGEAPLH